MKPMGAPEVERGACWTMYRADCLDVLPTLESVHVMITDPPYSKLVHSKSLAGNRRVPLTSGDGKLHKSAIARVRELGFDCIEPETQFALASWASLLVARWSLIFCNIELVSDWIAAIAACGRSLDYVRTQAWHKLGAAPQFTGDRPGSALEMIVTAHARGAKQWNGGGHHNVWPAEMEGPGDVAPVYGVPIELDRGSVGVGRLHTTQKPLRLMLTLVDLFSNRAEMILDPFAGAATTGVAAIRLGRFFIGVERDEKVFAVACERLRAEEMVSTVRAQREGQTVLFANASDGGDDVET